MGTELRDYQLECALASAPAHPRRVAAPVRRSPHRHRQEYHRRHLRGAAAAGDPRARAGPGASPGPGAATGPDLSNGKVSRWEC